MHPVSKVHFGSAEGQIAVQFHDGNAVLNGHIVKQVGSKRFVVSDGDVTATCTLAQTTADATSLSAGQMTILIKPHTGADQHVKNLSAFIAFTTEGNKLSWKKSATTEAGEGFLAVVTPPAPPAPPAPPPPVVP